MLINTDISCPICNGLNIDNYDCGYFSFNCGHWTCKNCGFEIGWGHSANNVFNAYSWEEGVDRYKSIMTGIDHLTRHQIKALGLGNLSVSIRKYTRECQQREKQNMVKV